MVYVPRITHDILVSIDMPFDIEIITTLSETNTCYEDE